MKSVYELLNDDYVLNCVPELQYCTLTKGDVGDSVVIRPYKAAELLAEGQYDWEVGDRHLRDIEVGLNKQGFSVAAYNHTGNLIDTHHHIEDCWALTITLVRAEDKMAGKVGMGFDPTGKFNPNFPAYNIIATGPLIREDGMLPRRIVLRQNVTNSAFVVHTQCVPDGLGRVGLPSFDRGDYFTYSSQRPEAIKRFFERLLELEGRAFPALYKQDE